MFFHNLKSITSNQVPFLLTVPSPVALDLGVTGNVNSHSVGLLLLLFVFVFLATGFFKCRTKGRCGLTEEGQSRVDVPRCGRFSFPA